MPNSDTEPGKAPAHHDVPSAAVFRTLAARRAKSWAALVVTLTLLFLVYGFLFFPQYYSSTTSIAMQQSTPSTSIAGLLSMGALSHKYAGVLKSRSFVERAEAVSHLGQMYDIHRKSDLLLKYDRCVKIDDNATDGLIYINVTLDGPAMLAWNADARRQLVARTAALIANTYYSSLIDYLVNVDSDKELVLLRAADVQLAQARRKYDESVLRLAAFVKSRRLKATAMPVIPSSGTILSGGPAAAQPAAADAPTAASEALALYARKAQLEAQIAAAETLHDHLAALLRSPFSEVAAIPGEDPLLLDARRNYNEAHREYEALRTQLGPDNPRLISARTNAEMAEKRLRSQIQAVLRGDTTENLNLVSLKSTYTTVSRQVADSERNFQVSRELTSELGRLYAEVELNLKVLEAAMTGAETLRMTTVSARNRANLVDTAIPEDRSHPGKGMITAVSVLLALVVVALWGAAEYNVQLRRQLR